LNPRVPNNSKTSLIERIDSLFSSLTSNHLIVDARDVDFKFGNVPGSINIPKDEFEGVVEYLVQKLSDHLKETRTTTCTNQFSVVFHCASSEVRGPFCATVFENVWNNRDCRVHTCVMEGGYVAWLAVFENWYGMVENYVRE